MIDAATLFARAIALEDAGRHDDALSQYRDILAQVPQNADAWHNQGLLLARLGRLEEAERSHREYARLHHSAWRAHSDLADVLLALGRYDAAVSCAARACELNSAAYLPAFTAGLACAMAMRFSEARGWFTRSQAADPAGLARFVSARFPPGALDRDLDPRAIYLAREFDRLDSCDWSGRDAYVQAFASLVDDGVAAPPLALRSLVLPLSLQTRRRLADNIGRRLGASTGDLRRSPAAGAVGSRIRIGYVSPDLRTHPTGILCAPLFRHHDRRRFEVHAFSLSGGDASSWRRDIESNTDRFHTLFGLPLQEALGAVRDAGIDVLVDLAGLTTGAVPELFAARAAPVQASFLGYPGTISSALADYLICDPVCVPDAETAGYGEALARLPTTFWICEPPVESQPVQRPQRASCGLPQGAAVLYAHHAGRKIYPELFAAWMEILRRAPDAVLWLIEDAPGMRQHLTREARERGIGAERLVFAGRVPHAEYRARIPLADLALDTPIYNGGATTLDALAAGVPVLTCSGQGFAGRMAASALRAADLADLVAQDLDSYVRAAIELATDNNARAKLAARVQAAAASSPLFDARRRTREIEAAFEHMLAHAAAGERPRTFQVPAV